MGDMLSPYEFQKIRVRPAQETFSGEMTITVEGLTLHLIETGPGHTDGDCMIWVPERQAVFAGDILFVGVTPVAWAGPVENIRRGLRRLLELSPEVIVPGHGPLARYSDIQDQVDYSILSRRAPIEAWAVMIYTAGSRAIDAVRNTSTSGCSGLSLTVRPRLF